MNSSYIPSHLSALLKNCSRRQLLKGQLIQFSPDRMIFGLLESGYVKRYAIDSNGNESIQVIYGSNEFFPLTPIFTLLFNQSIYNGNETFYYEAITDSVIYGISSDSLAEALQNDNELYKDLLYVCGIRLTSNIQRLENRAIKSAKSQVAHQLVHFAEKFGVQTADGIMISAPLTHQTLGEVLSLARETVTHSLSKLQQSGYLRTEPKLIITDIEGLRREAAL